MPDSVANSSGQQVSSRNSYASHLAFENVRGLFRIESTKVAVKYREKLKKIIAILIILIMMIGMGPALAGCKRNGENALLLVTTTSVYDSGLLNYLLPKFTKDTGIEVKPIAVGTGEAIKMAQRGDADIIIVHAPEKEKEMIKKGYALNRKSFMYNYFLIVGPKNDPAKIKGSQSVKEALRKIKNKKQLFVSRADNSGTHTRELKLWKIAGTSPEKQNYVKTGQGMGQTLHVANNKDGYTLTDMATFQSLKPRLDYLKVLVTNKEEMKNVYSVVELNPKKIDFDKDKAEKFSGWLLSRKTLQLIKSFGEKKYGQSLFNLTK